MGLILVTIMLLGKGENWPVVLICGVTYIFFLKLQVCIKQLCCEYPHLRISTVYCLVSPAMKKFLLIQVSGVMMAEASLCLQALKCKFCLTYFLDLRV